MNDDFKEELKDCYAEIERLSEANTQVWADNERLRAALREISDCKTFTDRQYMIDMARAALEEKPNDR